MYNSSMNKILIADDTKSWLVFHEATIRNIFGNYFEITTAGCAKEALNIVKRNAANPFGIIITDLQMENDFEPLPAGEWLVERIQELKEYSNSKIIIISAMYNIETVAKKHNVECISKNMLVRNELLLKFMFEKLMPFLSEIELN